MPECNQLTPVPFEGLKKITRWCWWWWRLFTMVRHACGLTCIDVPCSVERKREKMNRTITEERRLQSASAADNGSW